MLKVGLTGGLASGKSYVAKCFAEFGARVVSADRLGHETLEPEGEAYSDVVREFGRGILDASGDIDRKALGAIVFADPAKLARLSGLVHPHVFRRERAFFDEAAKADPDCVAVVEAAIMIEAGSYRQYDRIVVAVCPFEMQIERFMRREGASREQALERIARQIPLEEKRSYADYVIDTAGPKERTREQAREVFVQLKEQARSKRE